MLQQKRKGAPKIRPAESGARGTFVIDSGCNVERVQNLAFLRAPSPAKINYCLRNRAHNIHGD